MSERDTFHKEMEKLQDEVLETRKTKKVQDEDRRKFSCQLEMLKREVLALAFLRSVLVSNFCSHHLVKNNIH